MTPGPAFVRFHSARRNRAFRWRLALLAAMVLGCTIFPPSVTAQQSRPEEYQVKAAYLYNFGRFVVWPGTAGEPQGTFDVCVLGRDPFGSALDATLAGEAINNQKLVARRIANPHEATNCRILFISSSEAARIKEILAAVDSLNVLTVSDVPGFTSEGGMIQFVLRENKVRFEVNLTAAEKAGLMLSSQLLKVATDIRKEPPSTSVKP